MNLIFLFLTRSDIDSMPRIAPWLTAQDGQPHTLMAFVNPHLAINPEPEQLELEKRILDAMRSSLIADADRMNLEMTLQKRWMQIPREIMREQITELFRPFGITEKSGLVILNESFQADRLPELLTKIRPVWPSSIPLGQFLLVFPNQIPAQRPPGRPPGKVMDPDKRKIMLENLAKGREAKKKLKEQQKPAEVPA